MADETAARRKKAAETLRGIARNLGTLEILLRQWAQKFDSDKPAPPFEELEAKAQGVIDPEALAVLKAVAGEF